MRIAIIAPNPTPQIMDLKRESQKRGYEMKRIKMKAINITNTKEDKLINQLSANYDIVYFRNGADRVTKMIFGKQLSDNGILFINSGYYKSPLLSDKFFQMSTAAINSINVPLTVSMKGLNLDAYSKISKELGTPFIIKPATGAQGKGVKLISDEKNYIETIKSISKGKKLFQQYIPNEGDYRIITIGYKAIDAYKRIPPEKDFRANISQGGHGEEVKDVKLKNKLFSIAEKMSKALNLEVAGIDIIKSESDNKLYCIESNSIPQWQGFKNTTGVNVAAKILDYFEDKLAVK